MNCQYFYAWMLRKNVLGTFGKNHNWTFRENPSHVKVKLLCFSKQKRFSMLVNL